MFLPQEALAAAETNSKEVKKHNQQVNTGFCLCSLGRGASGPVRSAIRLQIDLSRLGCWPGYLCDVLVSTVPIFTLVHNRVMATLEGGLPCEAVADARQKIWAKSIKETIMVVD